MAVFNRIDLASSDGGDCGEYRVVYAKTQSSEGLPDGRFFIIFEARYPNPSRDLGRAGCNHSPLCLSLESESPELAVARASALFYDGLELEGSHIPNLSACSLCATFWAGAYQQH